MRLLDGRSCPLRPELSRPQPRPCCACVSPRALTWPLRSPPAQPATTGIAKPVQASRAATWTDDVGSGGHERARAVERARKHGNGCAEPSQAAPHTSVGL